LDILIKKGVTVQLAEATASLNTTSIVFRKSSPRRPQGRGILGVIDGVSLKGVEEEEDVTKRKQFLRTIGYKL